MEATIAVGGPRKRSVLAVALDGMVFTGQPDQLIGCTAAMGAGLSHRVLA